MYTILDTWTEQRGVRLHFMQSGKPVQNPCIESDNGTFRDECMNEHWFLTVQEAQSVIETRRREHNEERTHSTLGDMTPMESIKHYQDRSRATRESTLLALV